MRQGKRFNPARLLAVQRKIADDKPVSKSERNAELEALAAFTAVTRLPPIVTQDRPGRPAHLHKVVGEAV